MPHYIKDWIFPEEKPEEISKQYSMPVSADQITDQSKSTDRITNLSKINIFIGPNNSGKSRFLRALFKNQKDRINSNTGCLDPINTYFQSLKSEIISTIEYNKLINNDTLSKLLELEPITSFDVGVDNINDLVDIISPLNKFDSGSIKMRETENLNIINNAVVSFRSMFNKYTSLFHDIPKDHPDEFKNLQVTFDKIYIPTLRGLRHPNFNLQESADINPYKRRTLRDYLKTDDLDEADVRSVFTGLEMYNEVEKHIRGNYEDRQVISEYEEFLCDNFFPGKRVTIIPKIGSDVLMVKIGKEKDYLIYDLGDGIQQLIIMTFPVFMKHDNPVLMFIEEPELYLHPGLQRKFLEIISNHEAFDNTQFFFTTHSNHFLDITLDLDKVSVYKFRKLEEKTEEKTVDPKFEIEYTANDNTELLSQIGVRYSSVFLSNCTIWVEGITDRWYIRRYLDVYQESLGKKEKRFYEDTHFSFVEYGGSNIVHYSFLDKEDKPIFVERVCSELFLITDQDKGKNYRHEELRKTLGDDNYYCLQCREIENLLSPEIIIAVIKSYEGDEVALETFDASIYKNEYLGRFIEDEVLEDKTQSKRISTSSRDKGIYLPYSHSEKWGTLKSKDAFAKKAINFITEWSDLSDEAQELTKKIYEFIKSKNA